MSTVFYSNKEEIRNRIIKKAQEIWGIEKIYDFDPLVVLIMEALSSEMFNVTNDVKNLENRIFDKISRILASDNLVAPLPAHGIVHFQPTEEDTKVSPYMHMSYKKKLGANQVQKNDQLLEIDFSTMHEVDLFKGRMKYIATPKAIFEVQPNHKRLLGRVFQAPADHAIYLGVKCESDNRPKSFSGLNFYFDWGNYQVGREVYNLLALSKWYLNGQSIRVYRNRFMEKGLGDLSTDLFERKHFLHILGKDVEAYYQSKFLTMEDNFPEELLGESEIYPQEFKGYFDPQVLNILNEKIDWIKIEVPASISDQLLDELHVMVNAFPVINKRLIQTKNRLKILKNIIPIKTEEMEQLLTVENMLDKDGVHYSEIPYLSNVHGSEVGYYTVRHGSVERLDSRSAKDMVDYLFELIRDEKAAFSPYNADFLSKVMDDLDKNISLIHQKSKLNTAGIKEQQNYIVVNPKNESDLIFMNVWLTFAELGNGISVGSALQMRKTSYLSNESIVFLTNTKGGRSRLSRTESVEAFKYGITTADKIVTKNDIINFIRYELGSNVVRVELKNGVVMDTSRHQGFYKTLDIHLEVNQQHGLRKEEWDDLINQTIDKLTVRSTIDNKYRIILDYVTYA